MMNTFAIVILAAIVVEYVVGTIVHVLNLRSLRQPVPSELVGLYDPAEYERSQAYTIAGTRIRLVENAFSLALLIIVWFSGALGWLDQVVRGLQLGEIWTGLAYVGLFFLFEAVTTIPFTIYKTFVIEEKYGFNRTTVGTFIADRLKGTLLAVVIGGALTAAVLTLISEFGPGAWVYSWLIVVGLILLMQVLGPTVIMPMFNKFTPLEDGELRSRLLAYAQSVGFPLHNVVVVDGSRRSAKSNAFFTGLGRNKRVALFDTLIAKHSVDELVGVVAHEVGHYKLRHIITQVGAMVVQIGLLLYVFSLVISEPGIFAAFYVSEPSTYVGMVLFAILASPLGFLMNPLMMYASRRHEYQADRFAALTTGAPASMISALKTLSVGNLTNLTPHAAYVALHDSHPPLRDRVAALRAIEWVEAPAGQSRTMSTDATESDMAAEV